MVGKIGRLAIEIEEMVLGLPNSSKKRPHEELIGKAKRIQVLARRRKPVRTIESLMCQKCDLCLSLESTTGKYHVFQCSSCGSRVGIS